MALTPGTRFGPYEIADAIGAGGMGEVYRARDRRLERDVAIKVLPPSFASDENRLARFEQEAKTLASLNHVNIAHIYGLERSEGTTALAMELVAGPTLAERIEQGPIPPDEALNIALQIADGLEAAHARGIVHRDLKPANIKLATDGTVKVLDFGIAKALDNRTISGPQAPQLTTPAMTEAGIVLGTAQYMSPEQARGKPVDQRADIWAFGCVLYEMLTGQPAFGGEDVTIVLARVLERGANLDALPTTIQPAVRQAISLCLQKDPKKRVRDIGDVKLALEGAFETAAPPDRARAHASVSWKQVALASAATLILGAVLAGGAMRMATPFVPLHVTHAAITLTPDLPLSPTGIALSPDGQTLAMTAGNQIVLRRLDSTRLTPLSGTEGGRGPFFSPDGNWVGFVADGELRRIRADGSSRQTIGTVSPNFSFGFAWAADDVIYFGATGQGLFQVPASGGVPTLLTQPRREEGEISHLGPQVLEDSRTILFALARADGVVPALLNVETGEWRVVPGIRGAGFYAPSGHLLYLQGETLFAVPMSLADGTITGPPEALFDGVSNDVALSADGTLAYVPTSVARGNEGKISIVDRSGNVAAVVDDTVVRLNSPGALRFSPDAGSVVASMASGRTDLWVYDLRRGARTRLTDEGPVNTSPVWSPDEQRVAFNSTREPPGIYVQSLDAPGSATLVLRRGTGPQLPGAWSGAGRTLVFVEVNSRTGLDLWTLTFDGKATPLLVTPAQETTPELSPDGRWLAYQSDTAGRDDVYVASFPSLGNSQLVSIDGGTSPRWAGAGEIVYRRGRQVVSVTVTPGETLTLGRPTVLFEVDDVSNQYDVSPDGTKFLMLLRDAASAGSAPGQVNLVLNLFEELKRLVPTK
jgi:Tol biopolymer transport system component